MTEYENLKWKANVLFNGEILEAFHLEPGTK